MGYHTEWTRIGMSERFYPIHPIARLYHEFACYCLARRDYLLVQYAAVSFNPLGIQCLSESGPCPNLIVQGGGNNADSPAVASLQEATRDKVVYCTANSVSMDTEAKRQFCFGWKPFSHTI